MLASDITCLVGREGREMPQAPPPRSCVALSVLISLSGLQLLHQTGAVLAPASQVCWEEFSGIMPCKKLVLSNT